MMVYEYTPLIRLANMAYPKYFADVRKEFTNTSFPMQMEEAEFTRFGYAAIHDVEIPTGDVVDRGPPVLGADGFYYWTWTSRDFTPAELATNLRNAKDRAAYNAGDVIALDLETGIPYPFDGSTYKARIKASDITMLLSINNIVSSSTNPDAVYPFRFMDGYREDFSPSEFKQMVLDITSKQYEIIQRYWNFLNLVETITLIADIPDVPETFVN